MKTFPVDPYGFKVHFTTKRKEMLKVYSDIFGEPCDVDSAGMEWRNGKDIYIGVFDDGPECIDTLMHEIAHAVLDLLVFIQYDPSSQQEPCAYLFGYLSKNLMFAHPKFKEAMNEPVGTRAGNGGRRAAAGDGSNPSQ